MTQRYAIFSILTASFLGLLFPGLARAQSLYAASGITVNQAIGQPLIGAADVELDYIAALYYYPRTDGFLLGNGAVLASLSENWGNSNNLGCASEVNGYPFPGTDFCLSFKVTAPNPITYSTTYYAQTNAWVQPYYTQVNSTITYFDSLGFGLDSPIDEGNSGEDPPNATCYTEVEDDDLNCDNETYGDIYFATVFSPSFTTPKSPQPPAITGLQVNGVVTNTIIAGTSGYIAIYGSNFTGATSVSLPSGLSVTSFAVYNSGTQLNVFFIAQASAQTGSHNITITGPNGTSNGAAAVTVAISLTSFSFTNSVVYDRDCNGGAAPISSPTWPAPKPSVCPLTGGFTGDHAIYSSGTIMKGNVALTVSPAPTQSVPNVKIQGILSGNRGNFLATVTLPAGTTAPSPFAVIGDTGLQPSQTSFINPLTVNWDISQSGSNCPTGCASVGVSQNPVYVTLAASILPAKFGPMMLSYVSLAVAGGGATTPSVAASNTWTKFSTGNGPANVATWDGRALLYYAPGVGFNACATLAGPLVEGLTNSSGQCGAFALLLESALAANGIPSNYISIGATDSSLMVIKNWALGTPSFAPSAPWEYKLLINSGDFMVPMPTTFGDLTYENGLSGQNNANPSEKVFGSHFIVQVPSISGNQYLDPSYGVSYPSSSGFESQAVFGYAKKINQDPAGQYHLRVAVIQGVASNITFAVNTSYSMP